MIKSPTTKTYVRQDSTRSSIDFDNINKRNEYDGDMEQKFENVEKTIDDLYQVLKTEEKELGKEQAEIMGRYDQYETYHHLSQMKHHLKRALYHRRRFTVPQRPAEIVEKIEEPLTQNHEVDTIDIAYISEEPNEDGVVLRKKKVVMHVEEAATIVPVEEDISEKIQRELSNGVVDESVSKEEEEEEVTASSTVEDVENMEKSPLAQHQEIESKDIMYEPEERNNVVMHVQDDVNTVPVEEDVSEKVQEELSNMVTNGCAAKASIYKNRKCFLRKATSKVEDVVMPVEDDVTNANVAQNVSQKVKVELPNEVADDSVSKENITESSTAENGEKMEDSPISQHQEVESKDIMNTQEERNEEDVTLRKTNVDDNVSNAHVEKDVSQKGQEELSNGVADDSVSKEDVTESYTAENVEMMEKSHVTQHQEMEFKNIMHMSEEQNGEVVVLRKNNVVIDVENDTTTAHGQEDVSEKVNEELANEMADECALKQDVTVSSTTEDVEQTEGVETKDQHQEMENKDIMYTQEERNEEEVALVKKYVVIPVEDDEITAPVEKVFSEKVQEELSNGLADNFVSKEGVTASSTTEDVEKVEEATIAYHEELESKDIMHMPQEQNGEDAVLRKKDVVIYVEDDVSTASVEEVVSEEAQEELSNGVADKCVLKEAVTVTSEVEELVMQVVDDVTNANVNKNVSQLAQEELSNGMVEECVSKECVTAASPDEDVVLHVENDLINAHEEDVSQKVQKELSNEIADECITKEAVTVTSDAEDLVMNIENDVTNVHEEDVSQKVQEELSNGVQEDSVSICGQHQEVECKNSMHIPKEENGEHIVLKENIVEMPVEVNVTTTPAAEDVNENVQEELLNMVADDCLSKESIIASSSVENAEKMAESPLTQHQKVDCKDIMQISHEQNGNDVIMKKKNVVIHADTDISSASVEDVSEKVQKELSNGVADTCISKESVTIINSNKLPDCNNSGLLEHAL